MEPREYLNSVDGFADNINLARGIIEKRRKKIESIIEDERRGISNYPKPNHEVIKSTRDTITAYYLNLIFAMYSAGYDIPSIRIEYERLISVKYENWNAKTLNDFTYQDSEPNYGTDEYWEILQILALGILLDVNEKESAQLMYIRDKVATPDIILDFLCSYFDKRKVGFSQAIGDNYKGLAHFIRECTPENAPTLMKTYLSKQWFKDYKRQGNMTTHKSINIHRGYWSFESGAIMKNLKADDSILKGQQFYPYDMVNWQ